MSIDVNVQNDLVIVTESSEDITVNVSNAAGSPGVGVPVGGTTNQVLKKLSGTNYDTYWAADGQGVPYSGATGDVNLGEFALSAGQVTLDTSPTGTAAVATTRWNDTTGVSETTLKGGSVILKNGVDLVARVVNKVTPNATLTKAAYQAVRVSGAQGQRLAVAYAQANNDANSADTIGLVCETIATNQEGFIITVGQLEGINTTGSLQGETWVDGDVLYLSPFTAGAITKVKPTGNGHIVIIGYVEYAHVNNGKIYVKVMNGWELDELHDVSIVSPANNEALIYESATSLWKNKTIAAALGYTPISGTGATGQVAYWNGTNSQTGSNNLFWDAANARLGIGTNVPDFSIKSQKSVPAGYDGIVHKNTSSTGIAAIGVQGSAASNNDLSIFVCSPSQTIRSTFGLTGNYSELVANTANGFAMGTYTATPFIIGTNNTARFQLFGSTGNVVIQNGGTFTDGGQRLQVQGTTLLNGATTISGSITASSGIARGELNNTTLIASANNDVLVGLDINPTFTNGAFTGVSNHAIRVPSFNTTSSQIRIGSLELQSYSLNNSWLSDNMFFNGTGFQYRNTGKATLFYFFGGEGQFRSYASASAGTVVSTFNSCKLKFDELGNFAVGSSIGEANGLFTNAFLRVFSTGNVTINQPTTDAGYRLDVNGTARVSNGLTVNATGSVVPLTLSAASSANNSIVLNHAGTYNGLLFKNNAATPVDGAVIGWGNSGADALLSNSLYFLYNTNAVPTSTARFVRYNGSAFVVDGMFTQNGRFLLGTTTENNSAILNVTSTTQGFLPPRMTTTQKNAIGTPAAGLVVYDTDTNKLCCYNGSTWNDLF